MGSSVNDPPQDPPYPPPKISVVRALSYATGGAAATAGFLGCCQAAGILALISLGLNLWDFFQNQSRGENPPRPNSERRPGDTDPNRTTPPAPSPSTPSPNSPAGETRPSGGPPPSAR